MLISRQFSIRPLAFTGILVLLAGQAAEAGDASGVPVISARHQHAGYKIVTVGSRGDCDTCDRLSSRLGVDRLKSLFRRKCDCPRCRSKRDWWSPHNWLRSKLASDLQRLECRKDAERERFDKYLKDRFGYFMPSGCCGKGCPPIGKWQTVYAVNPNHFDHRDGQVFAAPGTGVPMAIPLPPGVRHQFNYSTGVPASRITPISRPVAPRPY